MHTHPATIIPASILASSTDITDIAEHEIIPDDLRPLARVVADALADGQTPARIGAELGLRATDDAVILPGIVAQDVTDTPGAPEHLPLDLDHEAAEAVARCWPRPDCEDGRTYWAHVTTYFVSLRWYVFEGEGEVVAEGEHYREHRVARDPVEPPGDHDWRDDGPYCGLRGNAGGVIVTEQCGLTGWSRITDTWTTDRIDGTQGHTSIRYRRPKGADVAAWLDRLEAEREGADADADADAG